MARLLRKQASAFLATSRRITQFSFGRAPSAKDRVVYIAGTWDLLHAGHVAALEKARQLGDFLLVGVYDDDTAEALEGTGFPLLGVNERALK